MNRKGAAVLAIVMLLLSGVSAFASSQVHGDMFSFWLALMSLSLFGGAVFLFGAIVAKTLMSNKAEGTKAGR